MPQKSEAQITAQTKLGLSQVDESMQNKIKADIAEGLKNEFQMEGVDDIIT